MSSTESSESSQESPVAKVLIAFISFVCTLALIPLLSLGVTSLFGVDVPASVTVMQSAMGYLMLAALPILAFAVLARRKALGVFAAVVAVLHVFLFAPQMQSATSLPSSAKDAPRLTLLSHNIRFDNHDPLLEVGEIHRVNADVVFLQELTGSTYELLNAAGAFEAYPYNSMDTSKGAKGLGIFSKYPLRDMETVETPGFPQQRAVVDINGRALTLWNIHTQSPVNGPVDHWRGNLELLQQRLHAEQGDVLVAGDFNATWSHAPFRKIISNGYREVANDRGNGFSRTWPVDAKLGQQTKGFIRIDHVLTRNKIRPVSIEEGKGNGSDHRAVVTQLVLLP